MEILCVQSPSSYYLNHLLRNRSLWAFRHMDMLDTSKKDLCKRSICCARLRRLVGVNKRGVHLTPCTYGWGKVRGVVHLETRSIASCIQSTFFVSSRIKRIHIQTLSSVRMSPLRTRPRPPCLTKTNNAKKKKKRIDKRRTMRANAHVWWPRDDLMKDSVCTLDHSDRQFDSIHPSGHPSIRLPAFIRSTAHLYFSFAYSPYVSTLSASSMSRPFDASLPLSLSVLSFFSSSWPHCSVRPPPRNQIGLLYTPVHNFCFTMFLFFLRCPHLVNSVSRQQVRREGEGSVETEGVGGKTKMVAFTFCKISLINSACVKLQGCDTRVITLC